MGLNPSSASHNLSHFVQSLISFSNIKTPSTSFRSGYLTDFIWFALGSPQFSYGKLQIKSMLNEIILRG